MNNTSLLFVCMGNICRSPTAHGVMQNLLEAEGLTESITVDSAGTHGYHIGEQSDARSRAKAREKGVDMEFIRARKISINDYNEFDYILAMDNDNLELLNDYAPLNHSAKIELFLSFANKAGLTNQHAVADPYYGGEKGFENAFELVDIGCKALLAEIKSGWQQP